MGGATVPVPGGGVGAMAFPSAAEPNPIMKGLRGAGTEQIINQITPPQAPAAPPPAAPAAPAAPQAPAPFSGAELFQMTNPAGSQYAPLFYSLQGGTGSLLNPNPGPYGTNGYPILEQYGYTDPSQVPYLNNALTQAAQQGGPGLGNAQYTSGNGQPGTLFGPMSSFSYNSQASPFSTYKPMYNPMSATQFNSLVQNAATSGGSYSSVPQMLGSALKPYGT
jgi:hypothetical protein